jgi:hypothetical protein
MKHCLQLGHLWVIYQLQIFLLSTQKNDYICISICINENLSLLCLLSLHLLHVNGQIAAFGPLLMPSSHHMFCWHRVSLKLYFFVFCRSAFVYKTAWQCTNVLAGCSLAVRRLATINYILFYMRR